MSNKKKINLRELDINNIGSWPREAQLGFCGLVVLFLGSIAIPVETVHV